MSDTTTTRKAHHYIDNAEMYQEVLKSREQKRMTERLGSMMILLCEQIAKRPNWNRYSYIDDMKGFAVMQLCRTWSSFDPEKYTNAFAYYSTCVNNNFILFLKSEKRHQLIRDSLLVDSGLNPSDGYTLANSAEQQQEDGPPPPKAKRGRKPKAK